MHFVRSVVRLAGCLVAVVAYESRSNRQDTLHFIIRLLVTVYGHSRYHENQMTHPE